MKKIYPFLTLLSLTFLMPAQAATLVEGKVGYFRPDSSVLREIYAPWIPTYQIEFSTRIWNHFHLWASGHYLSKEGHSLGGHQKTTLRIGLATLGLEYIYSINHVLKAYAGLGPRYFFVRIHNESHFVSKKNQENGLGGAFRAGWLIYFAKHGVIDIFADYSLKKFDASHSSSTVQKHSLDVSGISLGLGLGYAF